MTINDLKTLLKVIVVAIIGAVFIELGAVFIGVEKDIVTFLSTIWGVVSVYLVLTYWE